MDGYIERQTLQDIADAIREKNGSSGTYKPSEMAEAIRGIEGGGEGFDFEKYGLPKEQSENINSAYIDALEYTRQFWEKNKNIDVWNGICYRDNRIMYIPPNLPAPKGLYRAFYGTRVNNDLNIDYSNLSGSAENAFRMCFMDAIQSYYNLKKVTTAKHMFSQTTIMNMPEYLIIDCGYYSDTSSNCSLNSFLHECINPGNKIKKCEILGDRATDLLQLFSFGHVLTTEFVYLNSNRVTTINSLFNNSNVEKIKFGSLKSCTNFTSCLANVSNLTDFEFSEWKTASISAKYSPKLKSVCIHNIIQNSISLADEATARTLTLHATAKANWQNSEYYEQDLAVLTDKGITIA